MTKRRHRKKIPQDHYQAKIHAISHEGRGIADVNGKTTFIFGALPDETVEFKYESLHGRYDEGNTVEVQTANSDRVNPQCKHFAICGGCSLQHMSPSAQLNHKQNVLLEQLLHIGQVKPKQLLAPLTGPIWGYRYKARLGVKHVVKKEKVLVGFRERKSHFLADIEYCEVLHPDVAKLIPELSQLIASLTIYRQLPQIEVAVSDTLVALVLRHLAPCTEEDERALCAFAEQHKIQLYMQAKGPDTIKLLWPTNADPKLYYTLSDHNIRIAFDPADFTQINPQINQKMVAQALDLLELNENDSVLDLFCGLGNFSLPMAKHVQSVTGIEGEPAMVVNATANAKLNNIHNIQFHSADLSTECEDQAWFKQKYQKILLDPPRSGALKILEQIGKSNVKHIVYVSCNPATLARDADLLVNRCGYHLDKVGIMDMFPHTSHVESIAVFKK